MTGQLAALFVGSFFLGSIPFGFIVARLRGVDIRKAGSGNIGATNVVRVLGPKLGIPVFLLDVLKGLIPSLAAHNVVKSGIGTADVQTWCFLVGVAAVVGHMFSPFIGFKGGKGIATTLGVLLGAAPIVGAICLGMFILVAIPTRYVSLASIFAAVALPVCGTLVPGQSQQLVPLYVVLAAFVIYKHKSNIERLRRGTESKFSFKGKSAASSDNAACGDERTTDGPEKDPSHDALRGAQA